VLLYPNGRIAGYGHPLQSSAASRTTAKQRINDAFAMRLLRRP